jgi:hypothetical protein
LLPPTNSSQLQRESKPRVTRNKTLALTFVPLLVARKLEWPDRICDQVLLSIKILENQKNKILALICELTSTTNT